MSDEDPYLFPRKTKYRWSSQFGLYRYYNDDTKNVIKYKNICNKRSNIRYFAVLALFGVTIILICYLMYESSEESKSLTRNTTQIPDGSVQKIIDLKTNSSIIIKSSKNETTSDQHQPIKAEKFTQLFPLFNPKNYTQQNVQNENFYYSSETNTKNDEFRPLYFDELIPNLQPPPLETSKISIRRNYMAPNPFHFINKGPRPQAFVRPHNYLSSSSKQYPQLEPYRYPQNAMNIQDIIRYFKQNRYPNQAKRTQTFKKIQTPRVRNLETEAQSNVQINEQFNEHDPNNHNIFLAQQQVYADPFYQFKPSNPSDVNLLAPNKFRFAPTLLNNHRFEYSEEYQQRLRNKKKPMTLMLDIYPMTDNINHNVDSEVYKTNQFTTIKPTTPVQSYYNSRNIVPSSIQQNTQNENVDIYSVKGGLRNLFDGTESSEIMNSNLKMIMHLNLYPRYRSQKSNNQKYLETLQQDNRYKDSLSVESMIRNVTVPLKGTDNQFLQRLQPENIYKKSLPLTISTKDTKSPNFIFKNASTVTLPKIPTNISNFPPNNIPPTTNNTNFYIYTPESPTHKYNAPNSNINNITFLSKVEKIQYSASSYPNVSLQSGFYPINFNNYTFSSEPLNPNSMLDLSESYRTPYKTIGNINNQQYIPKIQNFSDRNDANIIRNIFMNPDGVTESNSTDHSDNLSFSLKNHKPYFSEVNVTLAKL